MKKQMIPWMMTAGRVALGPVLIAGQACGWSGIGLAAMVVTALLSDVFDGVLARRWKCDTAAARLFDSMADMAFYLCVAVALWLGQPGFWKSHAGLAIGLAGIEATRFVVEFLKYGKPASYHSYLAKTWGLVLAVAVVEVFATGHAGWLFPAALALGIVSNAEGLAMTLALPVWRKDLKTFAVAWRVRRELAPAKRPLKVLAGVLGGAAFVLLCTPHGSAQGPERVTYFGGTSTVAKGTGGVLETAAPNDLVFRADGAPPAVVTIPYAGIRSFEYRSEVKHRLGVLATIGAALLAARQRWYLMTVTYTDANGTPQVSVFDIGRDQAPALCATLRARAPEKTFGNCLANGEPALRTR